LSSAHDEPFFLLLTYSEVHTPVASPEKYLVQYDQFLTDESRGDPWRYYMDWADRPSRGKGEYYANISYMDAQMGRVLELLRQSGRLDDTLVIFSSDNGPVTSDPQEAWELNMAGETGGFRGRKRYLFEGGLRVPGIFRWPGRLASGVLADTPVTALDILPTIADYLELVLPEGRAVDGQSITGLLDQDEATSLERSGIFYWSVSTPDGMEYAVRDGWWKMILDPDGQPQYLFNLLHDRYEVHNLIQREPDRVKTLRQKFDSYRASVEG
jgi:arylsulfatase A-like enzyme